MARKDVDGHPKHGKKRENKEEKIMVSTVKRKMKRMSKQDFNVTIVAFLKACAQRKDLCEGSRIHAYNVRKRFAGKSSYVAIVLNLDQYVC